MTLKQKLNNLIDQLSPSELKVLCDYIQWQYAVEVKEPKKEPYISSFEVEA